VKKDGPASIAPAHYDGPPRRRRLTTQQKE
jgi:hypothetical protein